MKYIIKRGFFLTFLLIALVAGYTYVLFDLPLKESWRAFYQLQIADFPLGLWILTTSAVLGFSVAIWMQSISRQQNKIIEQHLQQLVETESIPTTNKNVPFRVEKALQNLSTVLITQRNSLKKITDKKAETQEEIIQERVVEERQRLARELHDSVSQQLFAASMLLSALNESNATSDNSKTLHQIEKIIQQAQLEMRALLLHLRPVALHNKSIAAGLEDLLVELKEKVYFNIHYRLEEVSLSRGAEDHLFRIAQETLSNTLRHAQATEVDVLFVERDGLAILRIQDNGVGFNETAEKIGSYGLQNVKERAIEIGATCKIVSVPSQGTIIEVKLPIEKEVEESD